MTTQNLPPPLAARDRTATLARLKLVRLVHTEVVLVAIEACVILLCPAFVLVLLGILGGLLLPSLRRLAGFDRLVLLLRVALFGHRHNRGINDLAAARRGIFRGPPLTVSLTVPT